MWKIRFYELKVAFFSLLKGRRVYQNWPRLCAKSYNVFERQIFNNLSAASDNTYFYLRCQCHHTFRKNHPPHNLKYEFFVERSRMPLALVLLARSGFATIFGSFVKIMQVFIMWVWKCDRPWKRRQHAAKTDLHINSAAVASQGKRRLYKSTTSDGSVGDQNKLRVRQRGSGLKCLLYEARNSLKGQQASESRELNPKMALSHIMTARTESTTLVLTKFGKSPQGSFASYQLSVTIQRATFWDLV